MGEFKGSFPEKVTLELRSRADQELARWERGKVRGEVACQLGKAEKMYCWWLQ